MFLPRLLPLDLRQSAVLHMAELSLIHPRICNVTESPLKFWPSAHGLSCSSSHIMCKALLAQPFWYGCETGCCILLNFLHRYKTVTFNPSCGSLEEPHVAQGKIWRTRWLGDGWDLVLHQKLLHCEAYVTWRIVTVQEQILSHFSTLFWQMV